MAVVKLTFLNKFNTLLEMVFLDLLNICMKLRMIGASIRTAPAGGQLPHDELPKLISPKQTPSRMIGPPESALQLSCPLMTAMQNIWGVIITQNELHWAWSKIGLKTCCRFTGSTLFLFNPHPVVIVLDPLTHTLQHAVSQFGGSAIGLMWVPVRGVEG